MTLQRYIHSFVVIFSFPFVKRLNITYCDHLKNVILIFPLLFYFHEVVCVCEIVVSENLCFTGDPIILHSSCRDINWVKEIEFDSARLYRNSWIQSQSSHGNTLVRDPVWHETTHTHTHRVLSIPPCIEFSNSLWKVFVIDVESCLLLLLFFLPKQFSLETSNSKWNGERYCIFVKYEILYQNISKHNV